jgi:hypothetical protein
MSLCTPYTRLVAVHRHEGLAPRLEDLRAEVGEAEGEQCDLTLERGVQQQLPPDACTARSSRAACGDARALVVMRVPSAFV